MQTYVTPCLIALVNLLFTVITVVLLRVAATVDTCHARAVRRDQPAFPAAVLVF